MDEQTKASRARFLGTVGAAGVAGAAIAGGAWRTSKAGAAAAPGTVRAYSSGHFALQLDGSKQAGYLRSVEGGNAVGEVVNEVGSAGYYQKKHIGNVKYENFTAEFGTGMSKDVYEWIAATLTGNRDQERKSGAFISADFNYAVKSQRQFTDALITEVSFPAMDASSKDPAFMTLKLAPEHTADLAGSGQLPSAPKQQKQWLPANFRFDVKGLPTSRVSKIEALTIKQTVVTGEVGEERLPQREPGKLEVPNLVFMLPEADAQPWLDYHEDFVINGNNSETKEKTAQLTYLAPNLKDEIGRLDFFNLGIFKIAPDETDAGSNAIRRVKVELYCERIEFTPLAGMLA